MKNIERISIALGLVLAVIALAGAPVASAQTSTLVCLPMTSVVAPGANVTFIANGAVGPFTFSGGAVAATTTSSNTFTTSFGSTGTQSFTVSANGQVATCSVNVQPASSGTVACILPAGNIVAGVPATFSASGGNGTYVWSATDLNITNPSGTTFTATYTTPGIHSLNATSNGQVGTCNFIVQPSVPGTTSPVSCSAVASTITLGQTASFNASGGNGAYVWSAPDLQISNPAGSGFNANWTSSGLHTMTVTSNGQSATCSVTILPLTTPGLPNTGFAPAQ